MLLLLKIKRMQPRPRSSLSLCLSLEAHCGVITPCSRHALREDDWGQFKTGVKTESKTGASIRTITVMKPAIMK